MQPLSKEMIDPKIIDKSHIRNFRELFGVDQNIDDAIIARQKEVFGFSLFLLHSKSIYEALKIGFLNSRNVFEKSKTLLSIPHTYIFGGMALGFILQGIHALYLFLPIFFTLIFLSIIPIFSIIREKVQLYKKSRIFFNLNMEQAEIIKREFMELAKFTPKKMLWQSKGGNSMDGNSTKGKIFMYLFGQPFIFGHLHYFAGFPISELIVFDIALLCILFGFFEKGIFFAFIVYYSIYFYFFDNFPHLFSQEDQERDFYMDIYKLGTSLLISMDALEEDMTDAKNGIIHKSLGINLSNTIQTIENLSTLIEEKSFLLGGKEKFQQFLIGMLNEILIVYSYIFDSLTEQILSIESDVNTDHLDNAQKQYLSNIIKPILENKREQLQNMKQLLLSKVIT